MDADPGHQWILLVIAIFLVLISFYFALYEQALNRTSKSELENTSANFKQQKKEKFIRLGSKLSIEVNNAHMARLTNFLAGLFFVGAYLLRHFTDNVITVIVGAFLGGIIASVFVDPLFIELPQKFSGKNLVKRVVKLYNYEHFAVVLFTPLTLISSWLSEALGKVQVEEVSKNKPLSWESIIDLIEEGHSKGEIDNDEFEMINGILSLHEQMAREVMVPRIDSFMIDITNDNDRSIDDILQMNYSRVPVYHEDKDKVVGVVHIKNLVKAARKFGFDHITIRQIMQEPFFVPETITIDQLLYEMKKTQNQMAILLDEYGGVVGIVTLEDLIEEIVGEITDESDEPELLVKQLTPAEFIVQGKMGLDDFNDEFGQALEAQDVDTIAGYMIGRLDFIPEETKVDTVSLDDGSTLVVHKMAGDRLLQLEVELSQTAVAYRKQRENSKKKAQAKLESNH